MDENLKLQLKTTFKQNLIELVNQLNNYVSTADGQWTIKGFLDVFQNIYTISADTKIVSKILEIHLLPQLLQFAKEHNYKIVLADHQNYYPDFSFVSIDNEEIKFAVDLKTTYRCPENIDFCNSFTLGSHGEYFTNRNSQKNIQFPYNNYLGHFCLGIIYTRNQIDETKLYQLNEIEIDSITSVICDFQFFIREKWEIASDSSGSGNTANIGSISKISDIIDGNGMFKNLGEECFDDYWKSYKTIPKIGLDGIQEKTNKGKPKTISNLKDFLKHRGLDGDLIVIKPRKSKCNKQK